MRLFIHRYAGLLLVAPLIIIPGVLAILYIGEAMGLCRFYGHLTVRCSEPTLDFIAVTMLSDTALMLMTYVPAVIAVMVAGWLGVGMFRKLTGHQDPFMMGAEEKEDGDRYREGEVRSTRLRADADDRIRAIKHRSAAPHHMID